MSGAAVRAARSRRSLALLAASAFLVTPFGCGGSATTGSDVDAPAGTDDGDVADGGDDVVTPDTAAEAPTDDSSVGLDTGLEADAVPADDGDIGADACGTKASCAGVCVDLGVDPKNCGSCGHDCTTFPGVDPAAVTCTAGTCSLGGACMPGRAHCSTNPNNGCETDVTTAAHCGSCTTACAEPTPICAKDPTSGAYACASGWRSSDGTI